VPFKSKDEKEDSTNFLGCSIDERYASLNPWWLTSDFLNSFIDLQDDIGFSKTPA